MEKNMENELETGTTAMFCGILDGVSYGIEWSILAAGPC